MLPFAFPIFPDDRNQSPHYRKRANRLALVVFTLMALIALAIKYLPS